MDPNEALSQLIEGFNQISQNPSSFESEARFHELYDQFFGLHEWLSKGGFLPDGWKRAAVPTSSGTYKHP